MNWISLLGLEAFVARWHANAIEGAIAVEDRLALVHLEWQEQKKRLRYLLVFVVAFAGLTVVALVVASFALIVQFWDSPQRSTVAWLVAGFWLLLWMGLAWALLKTARQTSQGFALSRSELVRDWQSIKGRL